MEHAGSGGGEKQGLKDGEGEKGKEVISLEYKEKGGGTKR